MDIKQHPRYGSSKLIEAVAITPIFNGELITGYKYQHPPSGNKVWPPFIHKLIKGVKPLNTATFPNILFPIEFGYYLGVPLPLSIRKDIPPGDYIEIIPNTTIYNVCTYIDIGKGWVGRHGQYEQYDTESLATKDVAEYSRGYPDTFARKIKCGDTLYDLPCNIEYDINNGMCIISNIIYYYDADDNQLNVSLPMNNLQFDGKVTYTYNSRHGVSETLTLINGYIDGEYQTESSKGRYRRTKWIDFDTFHRSVTEGNMQYDFDKEKALSIGTYVTGMAEEQALESWLSDGWIQNPVHISYINADGKSDGPSFILEQGEDVIVDHYVVEISWYINDTKVPFEAYIKGNSIKYSLLNTQLIGELKEPGIINIIGDYIDELWAEYIKIINTKIIPRIDITKYPQLSTFLKLNQ